jgi:hypothetical protein
MAIGLDVATNGGTATSSPLTWNHTCTGSNLILIVGVSINCESGTPSISVPTYNSLPMTLIGSQRNTGRANDIVALYYYIGPATGTHAVSVAFGGSTIICGGVSVSYTGVNQSGQPDAVAGLGSQTGANPSLTVTTVANNSWVVGVCEDSSAITAGLTSRGGATLGDGFTTYYFNLEDTNGPKTPAGNQTVNWTAASGTWGGQAASFAPLAVTNI